MAKRTIHMLVDDIDGGEADETVRFAVDGVQYEIDLSKKNATKMRNAFARYIEAGSKVGRIGSAIRAAVPRGRGPMPRSVI
jgi:methionine aminopeptidase